MFAEKIYIVRLAKGINSILWNQSAFLFLPDNLKTWPTPLHFHALDTFYPKHTLPGPVHSNVSVYDVFIIVIEENSILLLFLPIRLVGL